MVFKLLHRKAVPLPCKQERNIRKTLLLFIGGVPRRGEGVKKHKQWYSNSSTASGPPPL